MAYPGNVSEETKLYPIGYKDYKLDDYGNISIAVDRLMGGYTARPKGYLSTWSLLMKRCIASRRD